MARSRTLSARSVLRAKIVLHRATGESFRDLGQALGCAHRTAWQCLKRWEEAGFDGLEKERPGRGRKSWVIAVKGQEVLQKTTQEQPVNATHWSRASMAQATGVSESTVGRIWRQNGLKPHRTIGFKVSNDPLFEEKLVDIVALYLDPPEHAIVLSVDEKSQIQALDRTQPGLPMKKGRCGTLTHDYKRNGTTTLFAALNTLDGTVISATMPRHRHDEWLKFLKRLERNTPKRLALHIICDNYATHKHPAVKTWLEKHPRVHVHFTPTRSSWLNRVERFFRDITENRIRRGIFRSVPELEEAIHTYIAKHNAAPKPFVWTASANDILAKVSRARKALAAIRTVSAKG
jgi:transposase